MFKNKVSYFTQRFLLAQLLMVVFMGNVNAQIVGELGTKWWNDAVFYEVFVRSFYDSNGDGKGDLNGLTEKLDYLNDGDSTTHTDLGITVIWLMPIQESPSYHGYDVTDYKKVETDYGTNNDFKTFIAEAHKRGIKVIIDYVMNHTSSQHPWFVASKDSLSDKRDWYIWQNQKPTIKGPWGQNIWHTKNNSNYYGIFWSEMPDLNYNNADVKAEMFNNAKFWLEDMNVDGFRLDAIKYIYEDGNTLEDTPETIEFWKEFRTYYKSINASALAVGEAWTSTDKVAKYVEGDGLDFCFEFDLATAILATAKTGTTVGLKAQIEKVLTAYPSFQFGSFLTNHDMDRVMNNLGKTEKAKVAADLLLTLPGVPFIYYGEEIGMTGRKPDENIRKPLPWNSSADAGFTSGTPWQTLNADFGTKNIKDQQYDASSLWNNYRKLITVRNNQVALRQGSYTAITSPSLSIFSFLRHFEEDNIIVVSNAGSSLVSNVQLSVTESEIAPGSYVLVNLLGGEQQSIQVGALGEFSIVIDADLAPYSTFIYKILKATALTSTITFRVDMTTAIDEGLFNPLKDSVDIIADFNAFGDNEITVLKDLNGDGVYEVTVSSFHIGSKINYKYRINAANDGSQEFPNDTHLREYLMLEGNNYITDSYNIQPLVGLDNELTNALEVFPVPAHNKVSVHFSNGFTGSFNYTITDVLGIEKIATTAFVSQGEYELSCEGLPSGIYIMSVAYKNKKEEVRIVIQK